MASLAPLAPAFVPRAFLAALALAAACSNTPPPAQSAPTGPSPGPVVRFNVGGSSLPDFMEVPFPNDLYRANGRVVELPGADVIVRQNSEFITHELAKLDGFSRTALSLFYVDDTSQPADANGNPVGAVLDPATLPANEAQCAGTSSSVYLVDLEAADAAHAPVPCRVVLHVDAALPSSHPVLAVGPARGVVLQPGHAYATVLTDRLKTKDGHLVQASESFFAVRAGSDVAPALYKTAYAKVTSLLAPALRLDGAQVVGLAPYTTSTEDKALFALRDVIEQALPPTLTWDKGTMAPMSPAVFAAPDKSGKLPTGATASLDDWLGVFPSGHQLSDGSEDPDTTLPVRAHDFIAEVGTGVFVAENYLTHYQGTSYMNLDDATFSKDAAGDYQLAPDAPADKIWVSFAVPTAPMPASGYPLVVYQHGLDGSREDFLDVANWLCKAGWMVAAIDSITFGARAPEASWQVDQKSDFGAKYTGPDGFGDADAMGNHNGSTDLFGFLLDVGALRDQFRQAALDTAQLVRVLTSTPDLSGLALGGASAPTIDAGRITFVGQSLGAIEGATAAAIEPKAKAWVLNVGGGGLLLELATHGPIVSGLLSAAATANFGVVSATFDEGHPLTTLVQTAVEPGDPLAYAGYVVQAPQPLLGQPTSARNVLQIEVLYDEWVPNESNEALARAGGWGLGTPSAGSNAGITNVKDIAANPWRTVLATAATDGSGHIHDTPVAGVTAVLVQSSPAAHADNLTASSSARSYCIPFANYAALHPFQQVTPFTVTNPYLQTEAVVTQFFQGALGGQVPVVTVPLAPVRDLDGDGVTDDADTAPCDPHQQ